MYRFTAFQRCQCMKAITADERCYNAVPCICEIFVFLILFICSAGVELLVRLRIFVGLDFLLLLLLQCGAATHKVSVSVDPLHVAGCVNSG
jgi:hypothetical protein